MILCECIILVLYHMYLFLNCRLCNACGLRYHRTVQKESRIEHTSTPNPLQKILHPTNNGMVEDDITPE